MKGKCPELTTLADIYSQCITLVPGTKQGNNYRFDSGTGHLEYDGKKLEYDSDKCKITLHADREQGNACFRISYCVYPSIILDAIESGEKEGKSIDSILKEIVPKTPLRKDILLAGFQPTEDNSAECNLITPEAKKAYQLIATYIEDDPMYTGDKKTFISQRKKQAKHERGKRSSASVLEHTHHHNGSELKQPDADTPGSNPEPSCITL